MGQIVEEYSTALAQTQQVSYLTTDHLGSPRITTNENGVVTSRKDFSAFGEETVTSQRTSGLKYVSDEVRQDYTGYQKDDESGLEYAQARYYNTQHGRFTSIDPLTASATIRDPQSFNRYSYVLNSPYKFTDPLGLLPLTSAGACGQWCQGVGPQVDGSSISGTDTTFEHLFADPSCPRCNARDITRPQNRNSNNNRYPHGLVQTAGPASTYQLQYVEQRRVNYNGELLNGSPAYGLVVYSVFRVLKDGTPITARTGGYDITIEEQVENESTKITDANGNIINAPEEVTKQIRDFNTEGRRKQLFDVDGSQLGDRQGMPAISIEGFQRFKELNLTSIDNVTFIVRDKGVEVTSLTIQSIKTVDSVNIKAATNKISIVPNAPKDASNKGQSPVRQRPARQ